MENWANYQLSRYAADAKLITRHMADGRLDAAHLEQGLALLRTYLEIPAEQRQLPAVDEAMVRLTTALCRPIHNHGHWDTIVQLWPRLLTLAEQLSEPAYLVYLTDVLALTKHARGELAEATALYASVLNRHNFGDLVPSQQASTLHQAAVCAILQGRHWQARQYLVRCIMLAKQFPQTEPGQYTINQVEGTSNRLHVIVEVWEQQAYALNLMGNLELLAGRYDSAEAYYVLSLQVFETHGERDNLACIAYQSLGRLRVVQWRFPEAVAILERGLTIRRRRQDLDGITTISVCLAVAYLHQGQIDRAEPLLREAHQITSHVHEIHVLVMCQYYLGNLEDRRNKRGEALLHWQQALEMLRGVNMPELETRVAATLIWRFLQARSWHDCWQTAARLIRAVSQYRTSESSRLQHLWRLPVPI